jgi:adenylate cyclase
MPSKLLLYRLRVLFTISFIWLLFGFVFHFNLVEASNDLGVHISAISFAFIFAFIGLIITATLIFYLKPAFNHQTVWLSSLIKLALTLILFFIIAIVLMISYYEFLYKSDFSHFLTSFFTKVVYTKTFLMFILEMSLMTAMSIILLEVNDKYGPRMFWSMMIGEYHKPVQQNRIFIFLDINESTSIAEELGHDKYFHMLRRFFRDITIPVLANDGEIYQYVGDEIVLSWPNTPDNKIKALKFIRNTFYLIERQKSVYQKNYGKIPGFKAGVHAGAVTAGFIGVIKKELIYSGDTLNTTSRLCSMCHSLNSSYLLSENFMNDFYQPHGYEITDVGTMELRGRHEPVKVFSMKFD